tara:strand:+ start:177 stop:506 length:330 start_codon:yes stop_codon:yes gene_type:complete
MEENISKEEYLYKKLHKIEELLRILEVDYLHITGIPENSSLRSIIFKRYYLKLKEIDDLFVRAEYYEQIGKNILFDEIEEKLTLIHSKLINKYLQGGFIRPQYSNIPIQ